jgi:PadR family transcriptional regulator PadR
MALSTSDRSEDRAARRRRGDLEAPARVTVKRPAPVFPTACPRVDAAVPQADSALALLNAYRKRRSLIPPMNKLKTDLLQGTLDLMILRTLETGSNHGWGISQRIQQVSHDVLRINQGSLYPALFRLEAQGWIKSEWGSSDNNRRAKYYSLTRAGRRQLADETENWQRLADAIARVLETA